MMCDERISRAMPGTRSDQQASAFRCSAQSRIIALWTSIDSAVAGDFAGRFVDTGIGT